MSENYIVINGKKIELTEEQLKQLGIEPEKKRKNPLERVAKTEMYCYIDSFNEVHCIADEADQSDDMSFECSNYFNDETFAKQVALHQLLYRKLLKYAYDNECEDTAEWDGNNKHWAVRYDYACGMFTTYYQNAHGAQEVYFSSKEGAERAIKEVVEPFMKEHPEFVW